MAEGFRCLDTVEELLAACRREGLALAALDALVARLVVHGFRTWPHMVEHAIERCAVFPAIGAEWAMKTGNDYVLEHARTSLAAL